MQPSNGLTISRFGDIQIDAATLITMTNVINLQRRKIADCLESIRTESKRLVLDWNGESANAYISKIGKQFGAGSPVSKFAEQLDLSHSILQEIAQSFAGTERGLVGASQALPNDVFGV